MKHPTLGLILFSAPFAPAFSAAQSAPAAPPDDEIVVLSAFEVSAGSQRGYQASESAVGTRYAASILDQPLSVQVVTSEFIESFLAFDVNDVLAYTSSFVPAEGTGAFTLRGIRATSSQYKNGIREGGIYGPASVDRVEVIRGPNAAIYGATEPSGLRNVVTKQAGARPAQLLRLQAGSDDFFRAVLSVNQPLIKRRLHTRFDISTDQSKQYTQDFGRFYRKSAYNSSTWKIGPDTALTYHLDYVKFRSYVQASGVLPWVVANITRPDGGAQANVPVALFGAGMWEEYKHINTAGPHAYNEIEYSQLDANLTHRFTGWLSLRVLGATWYRRQNILRGANYSGTPSNAYNATTMQLLGTAQPRLERNRQRQYNIQADLLADFKTGPVKHKLLVTADYLINDTGQKYRTSGLASRVTNLNDEFWGARRFYNPAFRYEFDFDDTATWSNLTIDTATQGIAKGLMVSERFSLFGDRLFGFIGGRHDELKNSQADELNAVAYHGVSHAPGSVVGFDPEKADTIQSGIVYKILPALSAYFNFSQSFNGQRADVVWYQDINRHPLKAQRGEGWEIGIKSALMDGAFAFTVTYYNVDKKNVSRQAKDEWGNNLEIPDGTGGYYATLTGVTSQGVELDFNWKLSRNLGVFGSTSWDDISYSRVGQAYDGYLLGLPPDGTPEWSGALALRYDFTDGPLKNFSLRAGLRHMGAMLVDTSTYSIYGNSGIRAPDLVITDAGQNPVYSYAQYFFKNAAYTVVDLGVSREFRTKKIRHLVSLDVKNLLDASYLKGRRPGDPFAVYFSYEIRH
ncbi:MAG: TonB-dependent receptor [Opitutaceae bacterium]|jgi:iron complex outermembrane receptor protein|nr:TonB-dependent receptor [Opitutaceae bacterium]